jgi:hypothetical protein
VSSRNDQVFPVSLAEIAFTLVLILMLLLGYMFLQERESREAAESKLRDIIVVQNGAAVLRALERAKAILAMQLKGVGAADPNQLVQAVTAAGEKAAENARLQQEVADLTKRLVALEGLRTRVESAGREADPLLTREQVEQALVLQREVERLASENAEPAGSPASGAARGGKDVTKVVSQALAATRELHKQSRARLQLAILPGEEAHAITDIVTAAGESIRERANATSSGTLRGENERLQTQLRFYEKRDKLRGLDHPPCWMDAKSGIEYIFNVQTVPEGYVVTRGWPEHREPDARASEGFNVLMGGPGTPMAAERFSAGAKPFLDYGKKQSPECRHFVYLSSTIPNADRRDEARRLVNSFFYVLERKGPVTP